MGSMILLCLMAFPITVETGEGLIDIDTNGQDFTSLWINGKKATRVVRHRWMVHSYDTSGTFLAVIDLNKAVKGSWGKRPETPGWKLMVVCSVPLVIVVIGSVYILVSLVDHIRRH